MLNLLGKVPIKKSKLRRKRRNPSCDTDSSDAGEGRDRSKPTKKRQKRQEGAVIVDGSDADVSCSDEEAPYKRGGLSGVSSFLSFMPFRGETMELFGPSYPRWEFQARPQFPVIPHKPKGTHTYIYTRYANYDYTHLVLLGKQRGRPRETFWDKTFPSFQESQTGKKTDDPTLEAEMAQFMSSHTANPILSPPPAPQSSIYSRSLPSLQSTSTTEPPTPTSPTLTPNMAKLSLLAKRALDMDITKGILKLYS